MKTGALLFAFNTGDTDYLKLAKFSAQNIKRWLGLPTTLITDVSCEFSEFDKVITIENKKFSKRYFSDRKTTVEWRNSGRNQAYWLTPYDKTLLLDVDYIVASDQLGVALQHARDFCCYSSVVEISGTKGNNETFSKISMPMFWATAMIFQKTKHSEIIFELMKMVENNYEHYANLYGFAKTPFRNDYALSIALSVACGHRVPTEHSIPWPMINVHPEHVVTKTDTDQFQVEYEKTKNKTEKQFKNLLTNQDIHVMGKKWLENIVETG